MIRLITFTAVLASTILLAAGPTSALTVEQQVTPDFLKTHAKEWSLKVEKRDDGMAHFTLVRTLPDRKLLVSRLIVKQDGKMLADVSTPSFGIKGGNSFYVALSPAQLADSEYSLSESHLAGTVPIPGTTIHKISLKDFVK